MTRDELTAKIAALKSAAAGLKEPDKTFRLNDIAALEIELEGMALDELVARLNQMTLPDIQDMDRKIAAAQQANKDNQFRVDAFNTAFGILKTALGIVL
jgi:hypothetical protein